MKLILYRGLPGSGKTYMCKRFTDTLPKDHWRVFSADSFRYVDGIYTFDPKTDTAHPKCFRAFMEFFRQAESSMAGLPDDFTIIVDNTNISPWELAPYILAASSCGIEHEIRTVWCDDLCLATERTLHQVPFAVIFNMYSRMVNEPLPPFWKHTIIGNPRCTM